MGRGFLAGIPRSSTLDEKGLVAQSENTVTENIHRKPDQLMPVTPTIQLLRIF
ncbi:MAG: hypothetical protein H0W28_05920 [Pyrinomonadaceae bacterium]|nr:hypothetical protein [Pyrinomonadaceae bacterium]